MAQQITAQQYSAVHTLTSPSGIVCVFNDSMSPNYAGALVGEDPVTGLDSANIRTSIRDKVQADGAVFGPFFHGTRPVTLKPTLAGHATAATRMAIENRLRECVNDCLAADGVLKWTPTGSIEQYVSVRATEAVRIKGAYNKVAFLTFDCASPLIESTTLNTSTWAYATDGVLENQGWAPTPPKLIRITGPTAGTATTPTIKNTTSSKNLRFVGLALTSGQYVDIDVSRSTAVRNDGTSVYSLVDFPAMADWWTLLKGNNTVRVDWASGGGAGATIRVDWRHSWK